MPGSTIIDLSCFEQEQMLFELLRARFGYWIALHIILLCAAGYTPTTDCCRLVLFALQPLSRRPSLSRWLACGID